jgi:hypothetical protein
MESLCKYLGIPYLYIFDDIDTRSNWTNLIDEISETGPTGPTGYTGSTGPTGYTGSTGSSRITVNYLECWYKKNKQMNNINKTYNKVSVAKIRRIVKQKLEKIQVQKKKQAVNILYEGDKKIIIDNHTKFNRDICYSIGQFLSYDDKVNFINTSKNIKNNIMSYKKNAPINKKEFIDGLNLFNANKYVMNEKWYKQVISCPWIFFGKLYKYHNKICRCQYQDYNICNIYNLIKLLESEVAFYRRCDACISYHSVDHSYTWHWGYPTIMQSLSNSPPDIREIDLINIQKACNNQLKEYNEHLKTNYQEKKQYYSKDNICKTSCGNNQRKKVKIMNQMIPMNIKFKRNYR